MKEPLAETPPTHPGRQVSFPFKIVIATTHREPAYLHQTLSSLFLAGGAAHEVAPVHLMVGSLEDGYLESLAHHTAVHAHVLGKAEWLLIKDCNVHRRCCYNFSRCFAVPPGRSRGLIICEDDVVFQDRFLERAAATLAEVEAARAGAPFILAFYAAYDFGKAHAPPDGELFVTYEARYFFGTQCVYYSREFLPELADLIYREGFEKGSAPSDMLVKEFCVGRDLLLASRTSLVQHIGRTTTGLGAFHTTPSFGRPLPEERTAGNPAPLP